MALWSVLRQPLFQEDHRRATSQRLSPLLTRSVELYGLRAHRVLDARNTESLALIVGKNHSLRFLRGHRDRSIVHGQRRNAHRLRAVEHYSEIAGVEEDGVYQRDIQHAVAVEIGNRGAHDAPARVKNLRTVECAIAVALEYDGPGGSAPKVGNDCIQFPVSVEVAHKRS